MTGGLAYLLRDSAAGCVCNDQSVRTVPLELDEELWLRRVLRKHQHLTGSPQAALLLRSEGLPLVRVQPVVPPCSIAQTWHAILKRLRRYETALPGLPHIVPFLGDLPSYDEQ
jgi:hypothetical protein